MPQPLNTRPSDTDITVPLDTTGTTSAHLAAVRLKSANKHIFRALLSLASAALLIRVAGLLNQIVVSGRFGAGATMDAYFVASTLPILLAQLLDGAIEASVIPVYARIRSQREKEKASILFSTLLNLLIIGTALLTLIMLIFRHQMILLSAPALDPFRTGLAVGLTPFIFPVLLLMVIIGYLECILNAEGQFGWPAYAGMLVPFTTAILVLTAGKALGVVMLCVGMVIGLCLQLCVIILRARRARLTYRLSIDLRNPALGLILMAAWPGFSIALISQASPMIDQIFASFLSAGSISALSYSLKLISVPAGVIFASVGRAMLPYLSRQASAKDLTAFKETLRLYIWAIGITTILLTAFMILLAHPIVQIIFQRGAFSSEDTNRTASTLIGFAAGLAPMSFGFIVSKAFNALGKNRILVYVTIFSVIANAVFDYIFALFWQSVGIALSTSAVYACTMFILLFLLRRMIGKLDLFTPPHEVLAIIWKLGLGQYFVQWITWKQKNSFSISHSTRRQMIRISIILTTFAAGVAGSALNSFYTLRVALGSLIILALLRYHYALLLIWVSLDAFIGSSLPFFNGNNFDTGLTLPTLLLMTCMPIRQTFKRLPALAFLLIFLLWVFVSIAFPVIPVGTFLTEWVLRLDYIAVSVLTIQILTTRQRMMRLIDSILVVCTIISVYGIYGYFTKQNGEVDGTISTLFRISSIFGTNSPSLALFLSLIIPLAIYRAITLRGFKRMGVFVLIILFLVTLVLTFTRAAFISIPLSILVMSFFLPSRKMKVGLLSSMFALASAVVLVATVNHIPIFDRFFSQDITTVNNRTYLWKAVLDHFDPTKLLGEGLDASYVLLTRLQVGFNRGVYGTSPHNLFLGTLYEHGIIGVTLLIAVFAAVFVNLITGMRKATGEHRVLFAVGLAVLINMISQNLDSNDYWIQGIGIYFWIIIALPFALCWSAPKQLSKTDTDQAFLDEETIPRMEVIQQAKTDTDQAFPDEETIPRMKVIQQAKWEHDPMSSL